MSATMGYLTPEMNGRCLRYLSLAVVLKCADIPDSFAAISKVPALGWTLIVAYAGFFELSAGSRIPGRAHPATLASKC